MKGTLLVIVVSLVGAHLIIPTCGFGNEKSKTEKLVRAFNSIEDYLVKQVNSDKIILENMEVAEDWLENDKSLKKKETLTRALRLFTSMNAGNGHTAIICSRMYVEFLIRNDQLTQGLARRPSVESRRVDKLVNHYCVKQAKWCRESYLTRFWVRYAKMTDKKELVSRIGEAIISNHLGTRGLLPTKEVFDRFIIDDREFESFQGDDAAIVLPILRSYFDEDDQKRDNQKLRKPGEADEIKVSEKFKQLVESHLVEPCRYYVHQLEDIFEPVEFGNLFSPQMLDLNRYKADEYYRSLACYRICRKYIIRHKNEFENVFKRLL